VLSRHLRHLPRHHLRCDSGDSIALRARCGVLDGWVVLTLGLCGVCIVFTGYRFTMSAIIQGLRRFDAYPKTLEDFTEKTLGGLIGMCARICPCFLTLTCILRLGLGEQQLVSFSGMQCCKKYVSFVSVTIITVCIITQLSYYELKDYLSPSVSEELFVDTSRGPKLTINLDIVVPNIACSCEYW